MLKYEIHSESREFSEWCNRITEDVRIKMAAEGFKLQQISATSSGETSDRFFILVGTKKENEKIFTITYTYDRKTRTEESYSPEKNQVKITK